MGQVAQKRDAFFLTIFFYSSIPEIRPIDEHTHGNAKSPDHLDRQFQVIQPERAVFCDQEAKIASPNPFDDRAGGPRRAIHDYRPVFVDQLFLLPDDRGGHGLPHVQNSLDEGEAVIMAFLDESNFPGFFLNGLHRAEERTSAASMADFGKDQNLVFNDGDGVELADFRAFPAMVALFFIHLWNRKGYRDRSPLMGGKE
jgi:hypothetical protein